MDESIHPYIVVLLIGSVLTGCGGGGSSPASRSSGSTGNSDATLAWLEFSGVSIDQIFQSGLTDYTGTAPFLSSQTTTGAATSDPNARISINGGPAIISGLTTAIPLHEGANSITLTVTAEDGVTAQTYTVNIERTAPGNLEPLVYVKAANTGTDDRFGRAIAMSGSTLAVAANLEDSGALGINGDALDESAPNAGAVYVYQRDATDMWLEQAYIKPSNTQAGDEFGYAIALDGNTLAVSAYREDSSSTGIDGDDANNAARDSGAVYIFTRDATGIWSQQAYIKASNTDPGDGFGAAIALEGDTLVVGADLEDSQSTGVNGDATNNSSMDAGAVYVFTRDGSGNWTEQAYLKASNTGAGDNFGRALSLSGSGLAVGALNEASGATGVDGDQGNNSGSGAGAVYVFTRDAAGGWSQQSYIKASNTGSDDLFGAAVSLSGDTLVVGAPFEDSAATGIGGFEDDDRAVNSGAAYVFVRDSLGAWSQQVYIKASNSETQDIFGRSVAVRGNLLAVGAKEDSGATGTDGNQTNNGRQASGAVYLFERNQAGAWSQKAYLKASNTDSFDEFGTAIVLSGASLAVSSPLEDSSATGVGGDQSNNNAAESGAVYIIQ